MNIKSLKQAMADTTTSCFLIPFWILFLGIDLCKGESFNTLFNSGMTILLIAFLVHDLYLVYSAYQEAELKRKG